MSNSPTDDAAAEDLAEVEDQKDDQVLEREGVETELMDEDRSEVGERVAGVEEEQRGPVARDE
jgi:hypothetical protein